MQNIISNINDTITKIRKAINDGIDERIDEQDSSVSEKDKLTDKSALTDYVDAIEKLRARKDNTNQQLIILYTSAKNIEDAVSFNDPTISWTYNDDEQKWNDISYDFTNTPWKIEAPTNLNDNEKVFIRFVIINRGADVTFGTPVQLTGERGAKGEKGTAGIDGTIAIQTSRVVKLYYSGSNKPDTPVFTKDISIDNSNIGGLHQLSSKRIYYGNKIYVDSSDSDWKLDITNSNDQIWEIDVEISSKDSTVTILKDPTKSNVTITNTTIEYGVSQDDTITPTKWESTRPELNLENPYLWTKTTIEYSNGQHATHNSLIQELPTVIMDIINKYCVTNSLSNVPESEYDGWQDDLNGLTGPIIWKKETTIYNNNIGYNDSSTDTKIIITPISIQGPAGIQIIGKISSIDDLPNEISYTNEYIGKIGIIVNTDTYVWYGENNPELGCEQIGTYYWLNIGYTGSAETPNWDASKDEAGYIENRTHYEEIKVITSDIRDNSNSLCFEEDIAAGQYLIDVDVKAIEYIDLDEIVQSAWRKNNYVINITNNMIDGGTTEDICEDSGWKLYYTGKTIEVNYYKGEYNVVGNMILKQKIVHKLDQKYLPACIINITYGELKQLKTRSELIPGMQYRITDYVTTTTQENTQSANHQFDIIVTADDVNVLNENARVIQHEGEIYFSNSDLNAWEVKYCLDNDPTRFAWGDTTNGKGVIYYMKDEFNNECPYDFKNIMFKYPDNDLYYYTFTKLETNDSSSIPISIEDASINTSRYFFAYAYNNHIGDNSSNGFLELPHNIIIGAHYGNSASIYVYIYDVYIGSNSSHNYLSGSEYISISRFWNHTGVYNITLGFGCTNNKFIGYIQNSTVGNNCQSITCHDLREAKIGNNCKECTLNGLDFDIIRLDIGNNCKYITCPDQPIIIGNECSDIDFTYGKAQNIIIKDNCNNIKVDGDSTRISDIIFKENCSHITLKGALNTSFNNLIFEENCKDMTFNLNAKNIVFKNSVITNRGVGKTLSENTENKIFESTKLTTVS